MREDLSNRYHHDVLNRLVSTEDALGNAGLTSYDIAGRRISRKDREDNETSFVYDQERDWLKETHRPDGSVTRSEYNVAGQRVAAIDPLGRRVEFEFDAAGRMIKRRRFLDGRPLETVYEFDEAGNRTAVIDEAGRRTEYVFDELNRLIETRKPSPDGSSPRPVIRRHYDELGRLHTLTKANGATWRFGYDSLGRMVWEEDPLGHRSTYKHDLNGNVTEKVDPKGQVTKYTHDALNRLVRVDYDDGQWAEISHDCEGNITGIIGSTGSSTVTISKTFDELNRVESITNVSLQRELEYGYTPSGRRSKLTVRNLLDGSEKTTDFVWDEMGRIARIWPWTGNTIQYSYRLDGSRDTVQLPNGLTLNHSFDSLGRLIEMSYENTQSEQVAFFRYTLDDAGNRLSLKDNEGLSTFAYDRLDKIGRAHV